MSRFNTTRAAGLTLWGSRLAMAVIAIIWSSARDALSVAVALVALLLTALPARVIRDPLLRDAAVSFTALLLAAHIVLGMHFQLYESSLVYDKAMHVIGSGLVAALLLIAVRSFCRRECIELPLTLFALLIFSGTLSAGTLWEIFEFAVDRTGYFVAQRGLRDTMIDLMADALGALLVLIALTATSHSRTTTNL